MSNVFYRKGLGPATIEIERDGGNVKLSFNEAVAVYDYIASWRTKHHVRLGTGQTDRRYAERLKMLKVRS